MRAYLGRAFRPRIELLTGAIRARELALEGIVKSYRDAMTGDSAVLQVAAEFRIASLYHDSSIAFMFGMPPELEAQGRARLRGKARGYLRKAEEAYRRSLAAAAGRVPDASRVAVERWSSAAASGLRSVEAILSSVD